MSFENVGKLRLFLNERGWSCETLAMMVPVSNMTWRRLLAKEDEAPVPLKYQHLLMDSLKEESDERQVFEVDPVATVLHAENKSAEEFLSCLQERGQTIMQDKSWRKDFFDYRPTYPATDRLKNHLRLLKQEFPKAPKYIQAMILGGIAYLINPFDAIHDAIPAIGLVDDFGVLCLVRERLNAWLNGV